MDTTNLITVVVTDNGSPNLADTKTFTVTVIQPPVIQSIVASNDLVTITWSAIPEQVYRVQYKDDLTGTNWNDLAPDVIANGPVASKTDPIGAAQRFYRVQVVP